MRKNHVVVDEQREYAALIQRILGSPEFAGTVKRKELLKFLFDNRQNGLSGKEIESDHFGVPITSDRFSDGHARERCDDLREALAEYAKNHVEERWICLLPKASRGVGYQLEFKWVERHVSAPRLFWKPHLDMVSEVVVVGGTHLFFHDPSRNYVFRFYDVNVGHDKASSLEALNVAQPGNNSADLEPLLNSYLATGEIDAYDALSAWFHKHSGNLISRRSSREFQDSKLHHLSPILLGRPGTHRFIKRIMDSSQADHLGYRLHSNLGAVKITGVRPNERRALARFSLTDDGILSPVQNWGSVFGIVSRLRNPSGYGHVTIIQADYSARVIAQIVEALTDDKRADILLRPMNWSGHSDPPESFEMLLSVAMSPGNLEGEGHPELLCWRPLDEGED